MRKVIATWFYSNSAAEGGAYAQMRGDVASEAFRDVYRRCIASFFATAARANPGADLRLYTNEPWNASASNVARDVDRLLTRLNVTRGVVPYHYEPPAEWPRAWRNQFFVFDVLEDIARDVDDQDRIVLLDSDIVWSGSARTSELWGRITERGSLQYDIEYPLDHNINGLTRRELAAVSARYTVHESPPSEAPYSGGEFVALRGDVLGRLVEVASRIWPLMKSDFRAGLPVFTEEAHMLSFLYGEVGRGASADDLIRRVWTQVPGSHDARPGDLELALWHVPAEKRYGLARLYQRTVHDPRGLPMRNEIARTLGIPAPSPMKIIADVSLALRGRVGTVLRRGRR